MPNHIKNQLIIRAKSLDELKDFVKRYRTKHEAKAGRTHDGNLRYVRKVEGNTEYGFFDEQACEFKTRRYDDNNVRWDVQKGVPDEGWDVDITQEISQFPDFNKIIPMPEHGEDFYADGGLGDKERKKYGANNWYDWSVENWGTKWNSYSCSMVKDIHWKSEDEIFEIIYDFETAWSSVTKLVNKMVEDFPEISLTYIYADEDMGYNTGKLEFEDGNCVDEVYPEGGSSEAYELYLKTRPSAKKDFILQNGKYVYKEKAGYEYDWESDEWIEPEVKEIENE